MEGLAGFGFILMIVWALAGILFFFMILSIAIDCARFVRRSNKVIELLGTQNVLLSQIAARSTFTAAQLPPISPAVAINRT